MNKFWVMGVACLAALLLGASAGHADVTFVNGATVNDTAAANLPMLTQPSDNLIKRGTNNPGYWDFGGNEYWGAAGAWWTSGEGTAAGVVASNLWGTTTDYYLNTPGSSIGVAPGGVKQTEGLAFAIDDISRRNGDKLVVTLNNHQSGANSVMTINLTRSGWQTLYLENFDWSLATGGMTFTFNTYGNVGLTDVALAASLTGGYQEYGAMNGTPEIPAWAMMSLGTLGLGFVGWKRRKKEGSMELSVP